MKLRKAKKGFTIVELVIVIAVIAVLTAILVPTFINLNAKAKKASDQSLVSNLNTALRMQEAEDGEKNATMYDAVMDLEKQGFLLPQLVAKSDEDLVYSLEDNQFYLSKDEKVKNAANKYEFWKIYNEMPGTQEYSIYAGHKWEVASVTGLQVGFDAGKIEVESIAFATNEVREVIIRTNGGTLEVNAPSGTVRHFGEASSINIQAVADDSYHEFGNVGFTKIQQGHYVAESGAEVTVLLATGSGSEIVVDNNGGTIDKAYTTDSSAQDTQHGGNESLDYFEVEVPEGATEEEIAAALEEAIEEIETGATVFDGGVGKENDPYIIADRESLENIESLYEDGYHYYKVKDGVKTFDLKNWNAVNLNGSFDGNNVKINNLTDSLFLDVTGDTVTIKNLDITANISAAGGISALVGDDCLAPNLVVENVNVHGTIVGASWTTSFVVFGPGPSTTWNVTFKGCVSDATLVATSGPACGFIGHPYNPVSQGNLEDASIINVIDSAYIGSMSATGSLTGYNFKYFTINGNNNRVRTLYSEEFVAFLGFNPEGTLYNTPADATGYPVTINEDGSKTYFTGNYGKNNVDIYKPAERKAVLNTTAQGTLPANVGDVFSIKKISGATKAVISLLIAPNDQNNFGSYLGTYMSEEIDISSYAVGENFNSQTIKYFTINVNSGVTSTTGVSGNIFNVVNPYYGKNAYSGATVKVVQFNDNGNVLNITSIQIAGSHAAE